MEKDVAEQHPLTHDHTGSVADRSCGGPAGAKLATKVQSARHPQVLPRDRATAR